MHSVEDIKCHIVIVSTIEIAKPIAFVKNRTFFDFDIHYCVRFSMHYQIKIKLEYGPMPSVMAALSNIGGALCSMPQSLADAQYWNAVQ